MNYFLVEHGGFVPKIGAGVFIGAGTSLIGKVVVLEDSSIWYSCVLRGDVNDIYVGRGTNIQDGTVVHVDRKELGTYIGNMVTVGHSCVLHACRLEDYAFIGMGAVIMDGSVIESHAMVAAGSLVTKNKYIPSGQLWAGRPARFVRNLTQEEFDGISESAMNYMNLAKGYIENSVINSS